MMRRLWITGAVALAVWICQATAFPQTSEILSVDDVRRPVYRGNHRYNLSLPNSYVKEKVEGNAGSNNLLKLFLMTNRFKKKRYGEQYFINKLLDATSMKNINVIIPRQISNNQTYALKMENKLESSTSKYSDASWSIVQLETYPNQTKIVKKFLENPENDLKKTTENLDKLILSHTESTDKHIQMYPEGSPPTWIEQPLKPGVILVEDVHPSKLPKPPQYNEVPLYPRPTKPSLEYGPHTPVTKPSLIYGHQNPVFTKPSHGYDHQKPVLSKPINNYQDLEIANKPTSTLIHFNTKPVTLQPTLDRPESVYIPNYTTPKPTSVTLTNILTHYTPVYIKPPPEPPPRPPPPTIVVIESPSDNYIDCGNIQVVNSATFKHCPDVTVVMNANPNISGMSSAADAIVPVATGGTVVPVGPANGLVPLAPPPLPPPGQKPPIIIPVSEEEEEEEYDYEEEDEEVANDVLVPATTTASPKPTRPSTSTSLFSYLQALFTSLPFMGPISVSLWIIFLGPLSFLLLGAMGVASFIFPWIAPRLAFG